MPGPRKFVAVSCSSLFLSLIFFFFGIVLKKNHKETNHFWVGFPLFWTNTRENVISDMQSAFLFRGVRRSRTKNRTQRALEIRFGVDVEVLPPFCASMEVEQESKTSLPSLTGKSQQKWLRRWSSAMKFLRWPLGLILTSNPSWISGCVLFGEAVPQIWETLIGWSHSPRRACGSFCLARESLGMGGLRIGAYMVCVYA